MNNVEQAATAAAREAVMHTLLALGIDTSNPIKTQAEFASMRKLVALVEDDELYEDIAFVRRLRKASDTIKDTSLKTIAKWGVTGLLGIIAIGTKDWWLAHVGAWFGR